jgi:hemerythrin-like metal-binding protein
MEPSAQEESCIIEGLTEHYDRIFVLMGRVDEAITEEQDAQITIEDFAESAEKQLMAEEEFLLSHHGPEFRYHLAQHRFFARQVIVLKTAYRTGQLALAKRTVEFLMTWLNYHLVQKCRKYVAALPETRQ